MKLHLLLETDADGEVGLRVQEFPDLVAGDFDLPAARPMGPSALI